MFILQKLKELGILIRHTFIPSSKKDHYTDWVDPEEMDAASPTHFMTEGSHRKEVKKRKKNNKRRKTGWAKEIIKSSFPENIDVAYHKPEHLTKEQSSVSHFFGADHASSPCEKDAHFKRNISDLDIERNFKESGAPSTIQKNSSPSAFKATKISEIKEERKRKGRKEMLVSLIQHAQFQNGERER